MHASLSDRLIGASGAAIAVVLLVAMLLFGMTVRIGVRQEPPLTLLDLAPPRSPLPKRPPQVVRPRLGKASGRASPRNLRNAAAEIAAPPPPPLMIVPPPVIVAPQPGTGMAPSAGAADRPGQGQGAGGAGDGTGSGGQGAGEGDDGGDTPPRQTRGRPLRFSQLPPSLREAGIGGTVEVRYDVETDGSVTDCVATGSSGNAELDRETCRLIERRFRFRPSLDPDGRPVRSTIEESHSWIVEPPDDPAPRR